MKVLIIGSQGMLGQAVVRVFSKVHEVVAWDREELDITNEHDVEEKIYELGPDIVINTTAYNNVDGAEIDIDNAKLLNGYAVGFLAKVAGELSIPVVHYSTEYVFDGLRESGYQEEDQPNPVSAYGVSKYLGETQLQKHTDKFYLIRLSKLFGDHGKSLSSKKSFVELMIELAQSKATLDVVDEELSGPTFAEDLAERTLYIVENKPGFGIYHCTNSGSATWHGFAKQIFKITGKNVKLNPVPSSYYQRPASRPKFGILLNTKLPLMRPWTEALEEFLNKKSR